MAAALLTDRCAEIGAKGCRTYSCREGGLDVREEWILQVRKYIPRFWQNIDDREDVGIGLKIGPELAQRVARTVPLECGSQNYFGYSSSSALQHGF